MIAKDEGYFAYGTVHGAMIGDEFPCEQYSMYNNLLFFMNWIKKTMNEHEYSQCKTQLWAKRSSKKWIARVDNGCLKGKIIWSHTEAIVPLRLAEANQAGLKINKPMSP